MNICLLGEIGSAYWVGSATAKVQRNILASLARSEEVVFLEKETGADLFGRWFAPLRGDANVHPDYLRGGMLPILWYLLTRRPSVVHFMVLRRYMALWAAGCRLFRTTRIVSIHDALFLVDEEFKDRTERWVRSLIVRLCDRAFVLNCVDGEAVRSRLHTPVATIRNGVDLQMYAPAASASRGHEVLFAGGVGLPYKGLSFLEEALAGIPSSQYSLRICGQRSRGADHPSYIGELNEAEFIGELRRSRLLVVPSRYEPFSMAALEAMACGVPVVLTKECGFAQYLTDGAGCFIVAYGDAATLRKRIETLLADDDVWRRMSRQAREAAEHFDWQSVASQYIGLYNTNA